MNDTTTADTKLPESNFSLTFALLGGLACLAVLFGVYFLFIRPKCVSPAKTGLLKCSCPDNMNLASDKKSCACRDPSLIVLNGECVSLTPTVPEIPCNPDGSCSQPANQYFCNEHKICQKCGDPNEICCPADYCCNAPWTDCSIGDTCSTDGICRPCGDIGQLSCSYWSGPSRGCKPGLVKDNLDICRATI